QQRRAWPWVVLVVVIVMLIAAILLIKFINGGSSGVPVPSVAGDTEQVAQQAIVQAHLTVGPVKQQPSNTVPKGHVISTSPSAGTTEPKGTSITIIESSGPSVHLKSVPPVTNMKRAEAVNTLTQAGFKVHVIRATSAGYAPNTVVTESPQAGTQAKVGSTVTIGVTARQAPEPTVPTDVIGMPEQQAQNLLEGPQYGYMVTPQPGPGTGQPGEQPGTVYATSPSVGTQLAKGSAITIYVFEPSASPTTSSPSPNPSDSSSSPPPGQGTTGQSTTGGQSTPSAATPGRGAGGLVGN
ncbi:MAG TPA: PASTA domain-containing protein, partial [Streptosporangiaceae bacterium]|nr:PASTA domain-containing protein [Streptosporangiaceae bacterium]